MVEFPRGYLLGRCERQRRRDRAPPFVKADVWSIARGNTEIRDQNVVAFIGILGDQDVRRFDVPDATNRAGARSVETLRRLSENEHRPPGGEGRTDPA